MKDHRTPEEVALDGKIARILSGEGLPVDEEPATPLMRDEHGRFTGDHFALSDSDWRSVLRSYGVAGW